MEFRLSAEQELFKRTLREYCEKNIEPIAREIDEREEGIPDEILEGLAGLGVLGITFPQEYGGTRRTTSPDRPSYSALSRRENKEAHTHVDSSSRYRNEDTSFS